MDKKINTEVEKITDLFISAYEDVFEKITANLAANCCNASNLLLAQVEFAIFIIKITNSIVFDNEKSKNDKSDNIIFLNKLVSRIFDECGISMTDQFEYILKKRENNNGNK